MTNSNKSSTRPQLSPKLTDISIKHDSNTKSVQSPCDTNSNSNSNSSKRPLECLETLAQKAGITVDDCQFDVANTLLNLNRLNSSDDVMMSSTELNKNNSNNTVSFFLKGDTKMI